MKCREKLYTSMTKWSPIQIWENCTKFKGMLDTSLPRLEAWSNKYIYSKIKHMSKVVLEANVKIFNSK